MKKTFIMFLVLLMVFSNMTFAANINFSDVRSTDWYQENVSLLTSMGFISGYPDGSFRPNRSITKAEFVKTLVSTLGYTNLGQTSKHWASGYISQAERINIIDSNWLKDIDTPISRYEMARIISNTLTYKKETIPTNLSEYKSLITDFNQIPVTSTGINDKPLTECVLESFVKGIITGYPNGSFDGNNTLTRAEASSVIIRVLDDNYRNIPQVNSTNFNAEVLRLVNIERHKSGVKPLVASSSLDKIALLKSEDMALFNYFSHTSPNYGSPFDMLNQMGIKYTTAGENLAKGHQTPESVVQQWMDSPGHRKNILNPAFGKMGIGIYIGQTNYWTQLFTN